MKLVQHYNKISPELLASTKLQPGQTVKYRVKVSGMNGKRTSTPLAPNLPAIPVSKNIPPADQIWDDNIKQFVTIGAIRNVKSTGNPAFYDITFRRASGGIITLRAGRVADQEIHSYMMLTDFNGSKPDRDPSKPILFTFIDEEKQAEVRTEARKNRRVALNTAADLSEEDVRTYTAARGLDEKRTMKILRAELEDFADVDPDGFMRFINSADTTVVAVINRAIKNNKIKFNSEQSRFEWPTGETVLAVARSGNDAIEELATWLRSNERGERVFQQLNTSSKKPVKNNQQA